MITLTWPLMHLETVPQKTRNSFSQSKYTNTCKLTYRTIHIKEKIKNLIESILVVIGSTAMGNNFLIYYSVRQKNRFDNHEHQELLLCTFLKFLKNVRKFTKLDYTLVNKSQSSDYVSQNTHQFFPFLYVNLCFSFDCTSLTQKKGHVIDTLTYGFPVITSNGKKKKNVMRNKFMFYSQKCKTQWLHKRYSIN
ncbi:hypothetical protein AK88_02436 [Plasmodium fragile]|uniref:Uncharacterized protein n=1 Tax=Plasmodium fragile TaxID=5857 RepID=A0A0D9QM09_PLAFR|nr:uncharacterized protein AK88_02436 [Plasmodium fragile]KJP87832.1 hypothetical protein AK88_02436 [Plasmodium fragile]